jgi:hypothetical protein
MMPAALQLLIDHHRQFAIAGHVRQEVKGGMGAVSGN